MKATAETPTIPRKPTKAGIPATVRRSETSVADPKQKFRIQFCGFESGSVLKLVLGPDSNPDPDHKLAKTFICIKNFTQPIFKHKKAALHQLRDFVTNKVRQKICDLRGSHTYMHIVCVLYSVVMATLVKRNRRKASIMVFLSISKRSDHLL